MSGILVVVGLAIGLCSAAMWWQRRRRERRAAQHLIEEFPDAVDLLVVLVRAGLTPVQAVQQLAARAPVHWRKAFGVVEARRLGGERFVDALDVFEAPLGVSGRAVLDALASSERYGQALLPALDRLTDQSRLARRTQNEILARRLPVRLSIPLVLCTLPAFVLLTLAPLLVGAVQALLRQETTT